MKTHITMHECELAILRAMFSGIERYGRTMEEQWIKVSQDLRDDISEFVRKHPPGGKNYPANAKPT